MKKEKTINYSIRNKLFLYLTIIGIIPAFIMVYIVYRYSYERAFYDKTLVYDQVIDRLAYEMQYINELGIAEHNITINNKGKEVYRVSYIYDRLGVTEDQIKIEYTRDPNSEINHIDFFTDSYYYAVDLGDGIYLGVEISKDIYIKEDQVLEEIFFKGIACLVVLITTSSFLISYYLSEDLNNITANIRNMTQNKNVPSHIHIKELQDVEKEVEQMVIAKEKLLKQNYQLQLENKQTHIKMLQAQISPHFLYNALDSINWRLIENGDYETSHILISLSNTLRYSIEDSVELVPISTELTQIEDYLVVQKNRYYDSFNYEIMMDEEIKDFLIPKMIIQPLVENSLKHGVDGKEGAFILVQAIKALNKVYLDVYDNGAGMSEEEINKVRLALEENEEIYYDGRAHIGLKNTYLRLKGYYPNCKMEVNSVKDAYTSITLILEEKDEVTNC